MAIGRNLSKMPARQNLTLVIMTVMIARKVSTNNAVSNFCAANAPASDLFFGMTPHDVDSILKVARLQKVAARSVITNAGDDSEYLFFLWQGRARYFYNTITGNKLISRWITPGQMIGGAALARRPYPYSLSSEAVKDSLLLVWNTATIRMLGEAHPRFLENIVRHALDFIAWYVAAHACLASETAQERLAHQLVTLGPLIGQKVSDGVEIDVTNEELADSVAVSHFTVSRIMSEWQKIGAISKRREKVIVHSPDRLFVDIPRLKSLLEVSH
jgi:CRP/FNR family transcriptional regulator, nitrogen oxide reductase regulator